MGNVEKLDTDDGPGDGTVTLKIKNLQARGVLDKRTDEPGTSGGTSAIKTYPFVQKKRAGRFSRLFSWLKRN